MNRTKASPIVGRAIAWSLDNPLPPLTRYVAATAMVAAAAVIRATVITAMLPWLLFMPVVLLVALTMGRRTGLYAVGLSALAAMLTIEHPGAAVWLTGPQWTASAIFVLVAGFVVVIGADLRAVFANVRLVSAERERMHDLLVFREEQAQLLNHELGHRLKNLLAIMQAVASQTLRQSPDLETAHDALSFRLAAFGRAADVLTASSWETADLHALARAALANHDSLAERFRLDGPPIRFNAQVALALALAFHELATNATKYGALSNDTGHVDLHWAVSPGQDGAGPRFTLSWREVGGPPVQPPRRRGFGSRMIEQSLKPHFRGETSTRYEPDGLVFRIDAPLAGTQAKDSA